MAKSRDKGARAEYAVRDMLTEKTGVEWSRVPHSGAGKIKGDVMVDLCSGHMSLYCVEVKHYKDDTINSEILKTTNKNPPQLVQFWQQTLREAGQMNMKPLLVFKKDRGQWLCAVDELCDNETQMLLETPYCDTPMMIMPFQDWLNSKDVAEIIR